MKKVIVTTEESNTTRNEKARTVVSPYFSLTWQRNKIRQFVLYFTGGHNPELYKLFFTKKRLYKEGGFLSLILRYKF